VNGRQVYVNVMHAFPWREQLHLMTSVVVVAAAVAWAPRFVDIGANLLDPMFQGIYNGSSKHPGDLDAVLDRARARGVEVRSLRWPRAKFPRRRRRGLLAHRLSASLNALSPSCY
jgi:hypothetical protein